MQRRKWVPDPATIADQLIEDYRYAGTDESSVVAVASTIGLLLSVGAAALAIIAAPSAWAAPSEQLCSDMGGSTQCQRTANVQIYTAPQRLPAGPHTTYGPFLGLHNGRV